MTDDLELLAEKSWQLVMLSDNGGDSGGSGGDSGGSGGDSGGSGGDSGGSGGDSGGSGGDSGGSGDDSGGSGGDSGGSGGDSGGSGGDSGGSGGDSGASGGDSGGSGGDSGGSGGDSGGSGGDSDGSGGDSDGSGGDSGGSGGDSGGSGGDSGGSGGDSGGSGGDSGGKPSGKPSGGSGGSGNSGSNKNDNNDEDPIEDIPEESSEEVDNVDHEGNGGKGNSTPKPTPQKPEDNSGISTGSNSGSKYASNRLCPGCNEETQDGVCLNENCPLKGKKLCFECNEELTGASVCLDCANDLAGTDSSTDWLPGLLTGLGIGAVMALAVVVAFLFRDRKKRKAAPAAVIHTAAGAAMAFPTTMDVSKPSGGFSYGKLHMIGDRESQQDSFAVSPVELMSTQGLLAVVADGMGGLSDGDKMSQTVVNTMINGFLSMSGTPQEILLALTQEANQAINVVLGPNIGAGGSTLVAGLIRDGQFHYLSIGDSRICLYRNGQLIQLNREHIYVNELSTDAMNGRGTLYDALNHPKAGGLTSYLGMGNLKYVDIPAQAVNIQAGDKFVLMSDGVYNALTEAELCAALTQASEQAADTIGAMIAQKAFRNQDNYTAVILGF